MNQMLVDKVNHESTRHDVPEIKSGYTVKVHQKIKEGNKERIQIFEGLVIRVNSGYGVDKTFTVRRLVSGVGVEKIFPLHSPNIEKIEIVKKAKVRKAKMYYMRELTGKSARLKETYLSEGDEVKLDSSTAKAQEREAARLKEEEKAKLEAEKAAKAEAEAKAKEEAEKAAQEAKAKEENAEDAPKEEASEENKEENKDA